MALISVRRDYAPQIAKSFAAATAAVLHIETAKGGAAPAGVNHLPCAVVIEGPAAQGAFVYTDILDTTISINVQTTSGAPIFLPIAPAALTVGNEIQCTVFWNVEP